MMTSDLHVSGSTGRPIADRSLVVAGGVLAVVAGLLRLPASAIDPDATGAAVESLYFAIDVCLLFTLVTAFVAVPSSRSRTGTVGFVVGAVGTGLLIGPEPAADGIDVYAIGATAVTLGFALLALAWRQSTVIAPRTRAAFLATLAVGLVASASPIAFAVAGLLFSLGLIDLGRALVASVAR